MVDPTRTLIGRDPRWFLDDQPLPPLDGQPVTMGLDLASLPDVAFEPAELSDFDRWLLYGDGTGRPLGLLNGRQTLRVEDMTRDQRRVLDAQVAQLGDQLTRMAGERLHPGHMTRQRRRAAERAARKGRHEPR